jgi:hypothetical protein
VNIHRRLWQLEQHLPAETPAVDTDAMAFAMSDLQSCDLLDRLGDRLTSIGQPVTVDAALADPQAARLLGEFARRVQTRTGTPKQH